MSKAFSRTQRLGQLLKEEISTLLQREVKDARVGMVTVTGVEVSPDLKHAKVYVQVLGDDDRVAEALSGLDSAAGFIRSRLGRELRIRRAPDLQFVADRTQERAARIAELLAEIEEPEDGGAGSDGE